MIIFCDVDDCANYRCGTCGVGAISVELQPTRDFCNGDRVAIPACKSYKEVPDAGAH
jgi:hypothetical protein